MAAQAIILSLVGMPGIYFHSLFGSRNWREGVKQTKHNRTINRQKLERIELENQLADTSSLRSKVFTRFRELLLARSSTSAFDPYGEQKVLDVGKGIFMVVRTSPNGSKQTVCLVNITAQEQLVNNPVKKTARDLLTNRWFGSQVKMKPYQVLWLV
jgi:sucrose phosphorylase